jgi:tetratricopeptide (TPR) repeat protein
LAIDREATLKNAEKFLRVGRLEAAISEYVRVVDDQPKDWNTANALGDLYLRAGQPGKAVPLYSRVANHLLAEGFYPRAAALFKKILKITPDDESTQLQIAEISTRMGLLADARSYYTGIERRRRARGDEAGADEMVVRLGALDPEDLDARLAAAPALERRGQREEAAGHYKALYDELLKAGRTEEAVAALHDAVRCDPRSAVDLARQIAERQPTASVSCIDVVVDALVAAGEFEPAANLLQRFAERVPDQLPLLLKLVEVCVDGDLANLMLDAQARLAEAYLSAGRPGEARVIAEDLVARDPDNPVHVERLRRALHALNVDDVDVSAASMLSSDHTYSYPPIDDRISAAPVEEHEPVPVVAPSVSAARTEETSSRRTMEVDLTGLLLELQGRAAAPEPPARPAPELEEVFQEIRAAVDHGADAEGASDHFELARTYLDMGMQAEAIESLQVAARSPRWRFAASIAIGELYRDDGDLPSAIEWFERALEVPAPAVEQGRALLYDLGDLLETVGETARALAVFLELSADAPGYRDVSDRATRLARVETEG